LLEAEQDGFHTALLKSYGDFPGRYNMIYIATILSLLALLLGCGLCLFFLNNLRKLQDQLAPLAEQVVAHTPALEHLDQRLHAFEGIPQRQDAALRKMTASVEALTDLQTRQSLEIKRLLRREHVPLRFGIEPREPVPLSVPTPDRHTLLGESLPPAPTY
jgi:hypothetical protein